MSDLFPEIREFSPLVHVMTNPVTMNDVVNCILASGGIAICASAIEEVEEILSKSDGLLINTGVPDTERIEAFCRAGKQANKLGIPIVLDPVGVGMSELRNQSVTRLLKEVKFSLIRGNEREIKALYDLCIGGENDHQAKADKDDWDREYLRELSRKLKAVVIETGEVDWISDGNVYDCVYGGSIWLTRITGAGCMLSGILAAAAGAMRKSHEQLCESCDDTDDYEIYRQTLISYKIAAEEAAIEVSGAGTFHQKLMDRISKGF